MSLACVQKYLQEKVVPQLLGELKNGEIRFLALTETPNSRGQLSNSYQARTVEFFPCTWTTSKINEKLVAEQTRAFIGYKISLSSESEGSEIVFSQSDRLQLKIDPESEVYLEMEIQARMRIGNAAWEIYATEFE